jgi:alpha-mannosidase
VHDERGQVETRIRRVLRERIGPAVHGPAMPLHVAAHHVAGEPISVEAARAADYQPFGVGGAWGTPWGTTWFRMDAEVPAAWAGERVEAVVAFSPAGMPGFSAEALVWGDDGPVQGLHPEHQRVCIADPASGGDPVSLLVEAAANPDFSVSFAPTPFGDRNTAPEAPLYRLARADLAVLQRDVYELDLEMRLLAGLMGALSTEEPRRNEILRALGDCLDALDLRDVPGTAARARSHLVDVLAARAVPSAHEVSAVGHAHIDTAWLWPLRETRRKCARTFSTAVGLMDERPEYRFACSQAQQYAWIEEQYPALFERIRDKVASGQWIPVGGMWVEADANVPSGESLCRQLVHGQRYFRERFGVECEEVWIPDVFGYSAAFPQIMRAGGCRRFVTQKLSWNDTNQLPHHTFWWEGIDGSRVLTHFPPANTYNGDMKPAELVASVRRFRDHGRSRHSLYLFGYGDGGGGPTREMLERAERLRDLEGVPRVRIESPSELFARIEAEDDHPVWVGELYLEKHRGTYTTQAKTKAGNRRAELALREAELWAAAAVDEGVEYPAAELDGLWKALLTQQFHDILPGSSIAWVHREAETILRSVCDEANAISQRALAALASGMDGSLALVNPLTHDRAEVVEVDGDVAGDAPTQRLADGRTAAFVRVPGTGVAAARATATPDEVRASATSLENDRVRVEWDLSTGHLTSVVEKRTGREVLAGPGNVLQLMADHPNEYDAWDIDRAAFTAVEEITDLDSICVVDSGPLHGCVRIERSFGASHVTQDVVLRAGSARIDVATRIDWQEDERLLKVAFPVDVRATSARYEIQLGSVERPTHENTSWDWARFEVCGHTWADLAEPDFGVALLNDSKYGYDVRHGVMRLTLLRAPRFPDPGADRGHHELTYSLLPHVGDVGEGDVVAEAHRLNAPIHAVPVRTTGDASERRVATVDAAGIVLSAVKRADDGSGDWIVRAYEPWGRRCSTDLTLTRPISAAWRCDLHERPTSDEPTDAGRVRVDLRPFELVTLRVVA